ncbi:ORF6N domain-containing protein [Fibrobacter sp. UWEL]|uniref:ORF6N domain-containing protein n=1 Tax=Fibrobacter sp. UWEL TaxID=1896209 RepID=UPI00091A309F|nr:ORF6N domain-containing protein [Fibrobacter sp. UWEL]SHL00466.1 ORF6N domain-containing protein [Fibrobacter sp. UWEL]
MSKKLDIATESGSKVALIDENLLKSKVHTIRGVKVMLDADLAEIYGYETKRLNEQVKSNIERFDEDFRFQLTREEYSMILRSEKTTLEQGKYSKFTPYAFTEQGIYMLISVLRGKLAVSQSKALVRLFKEMKDYIAAENQQLLGCANCAQIAALTAQNTREIAVMRSDYEILKATTQENSDSLKKVMENFIDPATFKHFLILNGQKLEADIANSQIYSMAKRSIFVIDNYVDVKTLDLLRNAPANIQVTIFSDQYAGCRITQSMENDFKAARPDVSFEIKPAGNKFHDRYVVLDFDTESERIFHCGASSKDAGGKITTIMEVECPEVYHNVIRSLL